MRKKKKSSPLMPYAAGICLGYAVLLAVSVTAAVIVLITDAAAAAGVSAIAAIAAGSFVSGRTAGKMRRKNGLKTGAVCGAAFVLPITLFSVIFGRAGTFLLFVKPLLSVVFGAAGGVSGVNAQDG